ncbi:MAG: serine hydrolase domain-containing protein [Bacteroidota bacterium]|jgi:CubicO group peptidase (beta-lactamase class C family)|nr:beta-lactamase family protein [Cytophagales bacterium]
MVRQPDFYILATLRGIFLISFTVPFFLTSCIKAPERKLARHIDSLFTQEFKKNEPGGAVLIIKGEKVVFSKGYGLADLNTKEKITAQTLFNTGSISKTFVANAVLQLADEGKLSLMDSLSKYFPDFKNQSIANKVKIHHLLTHTSGLPDNRWKLLSEEFLLTAKDEENFTPIKQNDTLLFEPGSQFEYSNPAFNGLALIIEKIKGRKWQSVIVEKIFKPSGMTTSLITDGSFPDKGVSHAYVTKDGQWKELDYGEEPTFAAAGNGGIWSSVEELAKYEIALRKAVFLNKETIERSRTITTYENWKSDEPPFIGVGWFLSQPSDSVKMISHTGSQGGFSSDFVSIPEKEIVYTLLCNKPVQILPLRKKVLASLMKSNWLD